MRLFAMFLLALGLALGALSIFTVHQTEKAIVLRLGKIQQSRDELPQVYGPGLHFRMPLVDTVLRFDTRLQTMSIESSRILTEEKKDVIVDLFVKWRINNLQQYFIATQGNKFKAERLLREQVIDGIRAEFGRRSIKEVVSGERQEVMDKLRTDAAVGAARFGMEVLDVRVKRIDFPAEVSEKVFERMRTERERIAGEHRAEGRAQADIIRAQADKRVTVLLAEAEQKSRQMRGEGDAEAARIYAEAYESDADFYRFYRSLQAYKKTFDGSNDILVLSPEGRFFEHFKANRVSGSN